MYGAVDNITNFDAFDVTRAGRFCEIVDLAWQQACYERVGANLRQQALGASALQESCAALPQSGRASCQKGAGL